MIDMVSWLRLGGIRLINQTTNSLHNKGHELSRKKVDNMFTNNKKRKIIVIAIVLLLIISSIYFIWVNNRVLSEEDILRIAQVKIFKEYREYTTAVGSEDYEADWECEAIYSRNTNEWVVYASIKSEGFTLDGGQCSMSIHGSTGKVTHFYWHP